MIIFDKTDPWDINIANTAQLIRIGNKKEFTYKSIKKNPNEAYISNLGNIITNSNSNSNSNSNNRNSSSSSSSSSNRNSKNKRSNNNTNKLISNLIISCIGNIKHRPKIDDVIKKLTIIRDKKIELNKSKRENNI